MHSPWERPKGQSEGGGNSANRPSYCPARPCCTVSPLLILFLQPRPLRTGEEPTFLLLPAAEGLPCFPPSVNHRKRNPSFSSALSPLPKLSIPASNLGDKPVSHKGDGAAEQRAQLSPKPVWLHCESDQENLRTEVQLWGPAWWVIPENPPRGDPHPQEWQLQTPGSQSQLTKALLLEPVVAASPGGQDNCGTRIAAWRWPFGRNLVPGLLHRYPPCPAQPLPCFRPITI